MLTVIRRMIPLALFQELTSGSASTFVYEINRASAVEIYEVKTPGTLLRNDFSCWYEK